MFRYYTYHELAADILSCGVVFCVNIKVLSTCNPCL